MEALCRRGKASSETGLVVPTTILAKFTCYKVVFGIRHEQVYAQTIAPAQEIAPHVAVVNNRTMPSTAETIAVFSKRLTIHRSLVLDLLGKSGTMRSHKTRLPRSVMS